MVSPDPESIPGILRAKQDKTLWIGRQYIAGHHAHTYVYTLRQFSIINPPTGMFLEGGRKGIKEKRKEKKKKMFLVMQ